MTDPEHFADKIEANKDVGVRITWEDGHVSHWDLAYIRGACGCATCHELRKEGKPVYMASSEVLDVLDAELVGSYGISFHWSDHHRTGIYRWEDLRIGCPCDECRTNRRVEGISNPLDRE